ncbi:MAG: hypothetical protein A3J94_00310 [Syntrophus sp. RIFOXYC2_FULL_54_9]|nr:MAG: hypothetical protein A2X92_02475 [Syntrophus sp. GWC2_56_31]OHE24771.1 MAG: hypothetical protein A3J94_00310 [Syntrophus sp. RIFOXYC2_FULL_54_9]
MKKRNGGIFFDAPVGSAYLRGNFISGAEAVIFIYLFHEEHGRLFVLTNRLPYNIHYSNGYYRE